MLWILSFVVFSAPNRHPLRRKILKGAADMTDLARIDSLFFDRTGMDPARIERLVGDALQGMDDGELYLEYSQSESVARDYGRIKSASLDTSQAFGLLAISGGTAGYAHASA